jgi:hypothetical protein
MAEVIIERTEHVPERRRTLALAGGFFLAPFAWATQLLVNYSLTPTACVSGQTWMLHLVSLVALVTAAGGALLASSAWTRLTSGSTEKGDPRETGRRFMALTGLVLSLFCVLVILAQELPTWWLDPCQR